MALGLGLEFDKKNGSKIILSPKQILGKRKILGKKNILSPKKFGSGNFGSQKNFWFQKKFRTQKFKINSSDIFEDYFLPFLGLYAHTRGVKKSVFLMGQGDQMG